MTRDGRVSDRSMGDDRGLATGSDLIDSALYSAVQRPMEGMVQIAGKVSEALGGSYFEAPRWIAKPQEREAWSSGWCAQQIGNVAGTVPWILGANKGIRCLSGGPMARFAGTANTVSLSRAALVGTEIGATGALYEGLLRPVDPDNFMFERLRNTGAAFTAYGVMGGTASLFSGAAPATVRALGDTFGGRLAGRGVNGVVGFGAGGFGGATHSLTEDTIEGRSVSLDRMGTRAGEFAVLGLGLGLLGRPDMSARGKFEKSAEVKEMEPTARKTPHETTLSDQHWQRGQEHSSRGNFSEAVVEMAEAIKLRKQVHGADHPMVADNLVELATLQYTRGPRFYSEAQRCLEEALSIRSEAFGKNNSQVATTHEHLSNIHRAQNNPAAAAEHLQQAINVYDALAQQGALPISQSALNTKLQDLHGLYRVANKPELADGIRTRLGN